NSTNPAIGSNTSGLQHYVTLYADSRKWLQEGWIDYLAPQVYWYIGQPGANYGVLIPWWNNNSYGRHIYIGMAGYKVNDPAQGSNWANPSQIPNQVRMNRNASHSNVYGQAIYNTSSLRSTTKLGFRDSLRYDFYSKPALLPNMPWRDNVAPTAPTDLIAQRHSNDSVVITWVQPANTGDEFDKVRQYAVYRSLSPLINPEDADNLLAITNTATGRYTDKALASDAPYYYFVTALDRFHNESAPSNVSDYQAPIIAGVSNQEISLDAANCSATLPDYTAMLTVSDDVSFPDQITLTQSPAAGTEISGTGSMQITFTATDASGKSSSSSMTLNKKDVTAPVILVQDITRTLRNGMVTISVADIDLGTWDNCGLDAGSIQISQSSFDCSNIGENTVTLTARDMSGNEASATALVTIEGVAPQAAISLSRADNTYTGLPDNTIALGYGAQTLTLTATDATADNANTVYTWSPVAGLSSTTGAITEFVPQQAGTYTFTVEAANAYGCTSTATVTVEVIDVRCGENNEKVLVCHKTGSATNPGNSICVAPEAVATHLSKGGTLGGCAPAAVASKGLAPVLSAFPNPFNSETTVQFTLGQEEGNVLLEVFDMNGNRVAHLFEGSAKADKTYTFTLDGKTLRNNVYIVRLVTAGEVKTFRLMKNK
ncbi:MAG: family 10 glycosylhydrolase, partial [Hymenobacteraceae bacterium]|nr:family 10 glycosylhydrolase [Hymenobacteraceae bacterium]